MGAFRKTFEPALNGAWRRVQVGAEQGKGLKKFHVRHSNRELDRELNFVIFPCVKHLFLKRFSAICFKIKKHVTHSPLNRPALHVNNGHHFLYLIPVFSQGVGLPVLGSKACYFCNPSQGVSPPFSLCSNSRTNPKPARLLGFKMYTMSPTRGALLAAVKQVNPSQASRKRKDLRAAVKL